MKHLSAGQLALSFTGVFLGAGFVSGQELWQFFACFGPVGLVGFLLTVGIIFIINYAALSLVRATGSEDMARAMTPGDRPRLRLLVSAMQTILLFGVMVIMIAGASALIHGLTGLPAAAAGAVFTLVVALVALMGLQGLVTTFSLLVPVTTACAVILAAAVLFQNGFHFAPPNGSVSPMLPNWVVGALTYAAYNLFGTVCTMVTLAKLLPSQKVLKNGLGLGSCLLTVLAWSMIAAMAAQPSAGAGELPMGVLAGTLHPVLEVSYGLLMGLGMFSATLSSMTALTNQLEIRLPRLKPWHKPFFLSLLAFAYLGSLLGFGNLIGVIYPIFGYASVPFLLCVVYNWRKTAKAAKG